MENSLKNSSEQAENHNLLAQLRQEQDQVDRELIKAVAKRLAMRRKITTYRQANGLSTVDPARMNYVLDQAARFADEEGVPPEMARDIFTVLIDWSHKLDRQWRNEKKER